MGRPRGSGEPTVVRVLRNLDLVLLALALPVFLVADLPLLGYAAAGVAWLGQRGIRAAINRRAHASDDPKTVAGLLTASMIGRAWLIAGAIFAAGMVEREAGLAAAILSIALFTVYFSGNVGGTR